MIDLAPFEGRDTLAVGVEIRNAAGGLNDALAVDPGEWHQGEEITVVLRCSVDKIRFDPMKDVDGNRRVHVLSAVGATVIDGDLVKEQLAEQERRIEEAKGVQRLALATSDELATAHDAGEHADGVIEGCPDCDAEIAAAEKGD